MSIISNRQEIALRCHDISVGLSNFDVPDFELITEVGLMVRLSLHIRGLPQIDYETLKLVAHHFLGINPMVCRSIIEKLEEIEFIKTISSGKNIQSVIPFVPFYEDLYEGIGEYSSIKQLNEAEQLSINILKKLTETPVDTNWVYQLGAEKKLVQRALTIGTTGNYIINKRSRGKDILISPTFFSENTDTFVDMVAKAGAKQVQRLLKLIKGSQGIPLSIIETTKEINGCKLSDGEIQLLKSLAYDSAIKPPSLSTAHAGTNYFLFTPKPGIARLNPTKREIYERAMALVSAVRQGQYLPKEYAIFSPYAILSKLKREHFIGANSEAVQQYKQLTVLKLGTLVHVTGDRYKFKLITTPENIEAVNLAVELVNTGNVSGVEIDDDVRLALRKDQTYIESLLSANNLRQREKVELSEEQQEEVDNIFMGGV